MRYLRGAALAAACAFVAVAARAETVVSAVSAVVDAGATHGGYGNIADTLNQHGLSTGYTSGVTDWNTYFAGSPQHTFGALGAEWFSDEGADSAIVTYTLGSLQTISALALWNEEYGGIVSFDLLYSTDGSSFFAVANNLAPTDNPFLVPQYGADIFTFAPVSARYFRLNITDCQQPNGGPEQFCSIGEVAFRGASAPVPEPTAWTLAITGFAGLAATVRRRRRVAV